MSSSASRLLALLRLLGDRRIWSGADLAAHLEVSPRTLRRDVEYLRDLGYPVTASKGPAGGYSLGAGGRLPPLMLDDEQVLAVMIALQTAPASVRGIDDAVRRAMTGVLQVMPAALRPEAQGLHVTVIRNMWEFSAPPIQAEVLREIAGAIRLRRLVRIDYLDAQLRRPAPGEPGFVPPSVLEPHHLVLWAGRWYLVARVAGTDEWPILRLDRIHRVDNLFRAFSDVDPPYGDVADYVMTSPDRGDTPARWQCRGTVEMALPAAVVARWAPGGSVVEEVSPQRCRLTLGAWSWAGIAGLLATFDADFTAVEPAELRQACQDVAGRLSRALGTAPAAPPRHRPR